MIEKERKGKELNQQAEQLVRKQRIRETFRELCRLH
jgi:hypothetical protein